MYRLYRETGAGIAHSPNVQLLVVADAILNVCAFVAANALFEIRKALALVTGLPIIKHLLLDFAGGFTLFYLGPRRFDVVAIDELLARLLATRLARRKGRNAKEEEQSEEKVHSYQTGEQ